MIFLLFYLPVVLISFFIGFLLMIFGAVFRGLFKLLFCVIPLAVLIGLAILFSVGFHMIGLLLCFFLFFKLGSAVASHRK